MNKHSFSGMLTTRTQIGNGDAEVTVLTSIEDDEIMEHTVQYGGIDITAALGDEAFAAIDAHIMRNWQSLTAAAAHDRAYDMAGEA